MSESQDIKVAAADGILTVTFTRPQKFNAINPEMTGALWEAAIALGDNDDLKCMVITATGPYFSAGLDLARPIGTRPGNRETAAQHPGWNFRRNYRSHHLLYDEFEAIEKPIIVAAQGACLGAGLEMAVSCDFRFCTPEATFGLPEADLGLVSGSGGTTRLTRLVGPAWAKWLSMAGEQVDAPAALAMGLVHRVWLADVFMDEVYAFCRRIISLDAEAIGLAKLVVDMAVDTDRTTQRHIDRIVNTNLINSERVRSKRRRFRSDK